MTNNERRNKTTIADAEEAAKRESDTCQLIDGLLGTHQEYFKDPRIRLDFVKDQDGASFLKIAKHINARLRGETPLVLARDENEKGSFLPLLHTPSREDKPEAFVRGYDAIQEYISTTQDPVDEQIEKVSMAAEALVIWVHPFNDGNGRTARFIGQFIESGTNDIDTLVASTVSKRSRQTSYDHKHKTKQSQLWLANNPEILFDGDEEDELRREAENLPSDVEGAYLSVKELIDNPEWREHANRHRPAMKEVA